MKLLDKINKCLKKGIPLNWLVMQESDDFIEIKVVVHEASFETVNFEILEFKNSKKNLYAVTDTSEEYDYLYFESLDRVIDEIYECSY